jgi:hypothetical protein
VDSTAKPIKQSLREYLEKERPDRITEAVWLELLAALEPVSGSYLRELLLQTGIPIDQPYAGVRQHTLEELEESLRELLQVYETALETGDHRRARYCRRQVIAAKDKAKFQAQNPRTPAGKQALKEEMAEWMLVWLENPPVFPAWVEVRKQQL